MVVRLSNVYVASRRAELSHGTAVILVPNDPRLLPLGLHGAAAEIYDAAAQGNAIDIEDDTARRLILDRALEVEQGKEYVSGPAALIHLWPNEAAEAHRIDKLSVAALGYAQTFRTAHATALTRKLYDYNRLPLSPKWRRQLPTRTTALTALGLGPTDGLRRRIERGYHIEDGPVWLRLHRHGAVRGRDELAKLYVSPTPADFAKAVQAAVPYFFAHDVRSFKIAATTAGFVRPDKFVAYFALPSEAARAARDLARILRDEGVTAQPVPFSTAITGDGLVSVGYTPPTSAEVAARRQLSWRAWICQRLAAALALARAGPDSDCEPWEFAARRIELDGVDTFTWTPR